MLAALGQPAAARPVLELTGLGPPQQACTDFFAYVNGTWLTRATIPADRARIGGFNDLVDSSNRLLEFDMRADDAIDYGGIGAMIGHEIVHHFDDRGRRFDEVDNLADWWAVQDAEHCRERAARIAAQQDAFGKAFAYPHDAPMLRPEDQRTGAFRFGDSS